MMNKHIRIILYVVMLSAILIIITGIMNFRSLNSQLQESERLLSESRTRWESIAAEKEEIQADLKTKKNDLKEAELSLSESQDRSAKLKEEIEILRQEIASLENKE